MSDKKKVIYYGMDKPKKQKKVVHYGPGSGRENKPTDVPLGDGGAGRASQAIRSRKQRNDALIKQNGG